MANKKLSEITHSALNFDIDDFIVGLQEGGNDVLFSQTQVARIRMTSNRTFYVSTTGSDTTGDGTIGNPWQTLNFSCDYLANNYDMGGWVLDLQLADGTYAGAWMDSFPQNGLFRIRGNAADNTKVIINNSFTGFTCFEIDQFGGFLLFKDLTFAPAATFSTTNNAIEIDAANTTLYIANCNFVGPTGPGTPTNGVAVFSPNVGVFIGWDDVFRTPDGNFVGTGQAPVSITGPWAAFLEATDSDLVSFTIAGQTKLNSTPSWSVAFVNLEGKNACQANPVVWGTDFFGAATGRRFRLLSASINTNGQGFNFFPGDIAGIILVDGQYDNTSGNSSGALTVATLPPVAIVPAGQRAAVSDSDVVATAANFGSIVTHTTGSNFVPVYSDGTNWRIG